MSTGKPANINFFDQLIAVLEWLRTQRADSAFSRFGLFRVAFENPELLGSTFGAPEAVRRLNQFGAILTSTVRNTDLVARDHAVFWILTPECAPEVVGGRLRQIVNKVEELGLDVVQCSVSAYVFPLEHSDETSARELLGRLASLPAAFKFEATLDARVV